MTKDLQRLIIANLADLRRYAHHLSGGNVAGDTLIARSVRELASDQPRSHRCLDRRELFKICTKIALGSPNFQAEALELTGCRKSYLSGIPALVRHAIFLAGVCGMNRSDVAYVLGVAPLALEQAMVVCHAALLEGLATRILIVEDDRVVSEDVADALRCIGHTVVGVARTGCEAVSMFDRFDPGLIIADVYLADGSSGLEVAGAVITRKPIPIIFISAHHNVDHIAARFSNALLIPKPIKLSSIKAAVCQALYFSVQVHSFARVTA
ncbi:MAG: response regulator [Hyphomicrobium sp.]